MSALPVEGLQMTPQRTRRHRITIDFDDDMYEAMTKARFRDRVTNSDRLRALLALSLEDPELAGRMVAKVSEMAEEKAKNS